MIIQIVNELKMADSYHVFATFIALLRSNLTVPKHKIDKLESTVKETFANEQNIKNIELWKRINKQIETIKDEHPEIELHYWEMYM